MKNYISDSLISEALIILQAMKQNNCFAIAQVENIRTYYGINKVAALNLAIQCKWVVKNDVCFVITSYGERLIRWFSGMQVTTAMYRDILRNYIAVCRPIWARRIPYGRNEAFRIMSEEEQVCFKKAGLMCSPVTREEVDWWDSIAELERQEIERWQDDIGRKGEELTIEYEKKRTKTNPIWESINSNLAGFDIISQVSDTDPRQLLIEVKSSTRGMEDAYFFISQNEWNFASAGCNQNRYFFYIWNLENKIQLAIVSYAEMARHIPVDSGLGEWDNVRIPFSAFEDAFNYVNA